MADKKEQVQTKPEYRNNFKFMTNILKSSTERQIYVPQLKKITIDAQVTIIRIFVAGGLATLGVILFMISLANVKLIPYTIFPKILMLFSYLAILLVYLIGSRERSMLSTVFSFIINLAGGKTTNFFSTIGIKKNGIDKHGIIHFEEEDFGIAVKIVGNLQKTMLPSVSVTNQQLVHDHLVDRSPTSSEILISSISQTSVESQQKSLKEVINHYKKADNSGDLWRKVMAEANYEFIENNVKGREYNISQVLILRNDTLEEVEKDFALLQTIAFNGLYARVERLNTKKDVERAILPITDVKVKRPRKKNTEKLDKPTKTATMKLPKDKKKKSEKGKG